MGDIELIKLLGETPLADDGRVLLFRATFGKSAVKAIVHSTAAGVPAGESSRKFESQYRAALAAGRSATPAPLYFGPWADGIALVLEDRTERTLADVMAAGPLTVADAIGYAAKTAIAIAEFHHSGWLHRSIRPSHIGLTHDGEILLLGLGSVRRMLEKSQDDFALPLSLDGIGYLAPEQTGRLDRPMDWRTDIFSLGASLYALLAGRPPFKGDDAAAVLYDCIAAVPPSLDSLRADVSPFIARIVDKAMAKNPHERYRSLAGLSSDLELALERPEIANTAEPGARDKPEARFWASSPTRSNPARQTLGFGRIVQWIQDTFPDPSPRRETLAGTIMAAGISDAAGLEEFMLALARSGGASYDAPRGAWILTRDLSSDREIVSSIEAIVPGKIAAMDDEAARFLECASCAGDEFDAFAVAAVLHQSDPAGEAVRQALESGLIVPARRGETTYRFSHPAIRGRLYDKLETIRRSAWHSAFAERYESSGRPELAVPHILADPLKPRRRDEMVRRAQVFLEAAAAKALVDPEQAYSLASRARVMLGAGGWRDAYRTALAACIRHLALAASLGKRDDFAATAKELGTEVHEADYTRAHEAIIAGYAALGMSDEAVDDGLAALRRLGWRISPKPSAARAMLAYLAARMFHRLNGNPLADGSASMPDGGARDALKIIIACGTSAYIARPTIVPLLVALGMRLSARHGGYPGMAVLYAAMGFIESGVFHAYRSGYRFGMIAENLAVNSAGAARYCQTRLIAASFVTHWLRPFSSTLDSLLDAARAGKALGDLEYSSLAYCAFLQSSIFEGRGLRHIDAVLPEIEPSVRAMGQELPLLILDASLCYVRFFREGGYSASAPVLRGESLAGWQDRLIDRGQFSVACDIALYRILAAYSYADYGEAETAFSRIEPHRSAYAGQYADTLLTFIEALIGSRKALGAQSAGLRPHRVKAVDKAARLFRQWAALNPSIFDCKRDALLAIQAYGRGASLAAFDLFEKAAMSARSSGNLLDEALIASEYAFRLEKSGRVPNAAFQVRNTYDALVRWGALSLAQSLADGYPALRSWARASPGGVGSSGLHTVDAEALIQASSALVGELNAGKLVQRLLDLSLGLCGARYGAVWMKRGQAWHAHSKVSFSQGAENRLTLPAGIDGVALSLRSAVDRKKASGGSEALVPLVNRGKAIGVLQLRNDLVADAFPPQRLGIVEVIAAQAAVALENADLYEGLERKVQERTRELEDALRNVRRLRGLIPICSSCKKVRDDTGYWSQVEEYISARTEADFTHGLCPDCLNRYYDELGVPPEDRASEPG